jgi:hypothetical protein
MKEDAVSKPKMKDIRIFVASSKELERERNELAFLVLEQEEAFTARGLRVRLAKWEYVDPKMTEGRTEDRYLDEMYDCDAAFVLFRDVAGMYTREELDKALAMERAGTTRLKAHAILFADDGKPGSDAARLRESLPPDGYGTWSGREELRAAFLEFVERVAGMDLREAPSDKYVRRITAFLAADEELAEERNAFADTVLNVNDLLEQANRNIRVQLRFYDPANADSVLESSEMGLVLYGTNYRVFGRKEIEDIHARVKDGSRNPKRFYVFFRELDEASEKSLDDTFKSFRSDFVSKLGHFTCEFGDANALRLGFLLSLERYAGESVELYATVSAPTAPVFVGREKELRRLHELLEPVPGKFPAGRLPVITGAGGTGKSELVRQYASQLRVQYPGGVFQVDMERRRTWDDAFLGLLDGVPNNGISVRDYLEIESDKTDGEESNDSESITGAKVRDALLKKARSAGPMLLVLDNVEGCLPLLGRDGGFAKAFPSGFSERVLVNVVATARVCDVMLRPGDWAVPFPLGDLSPDDAMELLLGDRTDVASEERAAAGRVAELLGYRALYLRRVPALIGDLYAETICDSYAELAKALEENLLGTVAEETEGTHLPDVLWNMTRERLLKMSLGPECVKLAQVASYFSPDGAPQYFLKYLWKTVVAPNQDERKFARAVEILKHHNIFQSTDPVRIHRLDRAAILQTAKAEPGLEDAIGAAFVSGGLLLKDEWAILYEHEKIRAHLPEAMAEDGDFWVSVLWNYPGLAEDCPWEKLDGWDWVHLLGKQPQHADRCAWEKLSIEAWGNLLEAQPQFADLCPTEYLTGYSWYCILSRQPQLADRCSWEKLHGGNWSQLLREQPQFATRCPWEKLRGGDWSLLLCKRPQFACYCPWEKLDGNNWSTLLLEQPRLADCCVWEKLSGKNWSTLLRERPQLADRCVWEKLSGRDWVCLLDKQPQFAERCPWKKLRAGDWVSLLGKHPEFADRCPWEKLEGENWSGLLREQPQFLARCPWERLDGKDWGALLVQQPQFADRCPWEKLDGKNWTELLCGQPQFAAHCTWKRLTVEDWIKLLRWQPQFAPHCAWEKLTEKDWIKLLCEQPQFAEFCPWEKLDGWAWSELLNMQPQFADRCAWEKLEGGDWAYLLSYEPQFAERCPWNTLDGCHWKDLLQRQPQFADHCDWEKLNGKDWREVLCEQPQFSGYCAWEKLSGGEWRNLLSERPQFAPHCAWEKLEGGDWSKLLCEQPQFAELCPWEKLGVWNWIELLRKQPQLADRCPWEKLDGWGWVNLLGEQPQFAERCPWEKLDRDDWAYLLGLQPRLAGHCPPEKRPEGME